VIAFHVIYKSINTGKLHFVIQSTYNQRADFSGEKSPQKTLVPVNSAVAMLRMGTRSNTQRVPGYKNTRKSEQLPVNREMPQSYFMYFVYAFFVNYN